MNEKQLRLGGHMATLALVALVQMIGGSPVVTGIAGAVSGILKDEVQATIWYPKMSKGWKLTRYFNFSYEQYPGQHLYMSWSDVIHDHEREQVERRNHGQSHCRVGGYFGIPKKLVRKIMNSYPIHTIKFK